MTTDNGFNIPLPSIDGMQVDDNLYQAERKDYPGITWHGKGAGSGFFTIEKDSIPGQRPMPYWTETMHRFGSNPNNPETPVWRTERLRAVPIAVRKRGAVEDSRGTTHYYPLYTRKEDRVSGRWSSHYQVMLVIPGLNDLMVLGLWGYAKTKSWDNNKTDDGFPFGVEVKLKEYANRASHQTGMRIPWLCAWEIDLVPAYKDGRPYFVNVGNDTHMIPFTVDMRTAADDKAFGDLTTRFVGVDLFNAYQVLRAENGLPWENEWKSADTMADNNQSGRSSNGAGEDDPDEVIGQAARTADTIPGFGPEVAAPTNGNGHANGNGNGQHITDIAFDIPFDM
mgnify:CR=1 FL=1